MKKFITIAAVAAFLVMGTSASAATDLQSQIDALLQQIAALQGTTATTTTSGSMLSAHNGVNLSVGSRGTRVSELQRCMNAAGYNTGIVDGIFGSNTKAGVMSFQASKGLVVDGIVGVQTTPVFQAACMTGTSTTTTPTTTTTTSTDGEEGEVIAVEIKGGDDDILLSDSKGQALFEIDIEAEEDGSDVSIERIDLTFAVTGDETKNYKVIDAVEVEGFGSENTDDNDDWRSDDVTVRLSGSSVVKAGETETFVVMLDIAEFDEAVGQDVTLSTVEIRYVDQAGVTYTNDIASSGSETVAYDADSIFSIDVSENDDQEDDKTIDLDGDANGVVVAMFDLEVDEDVEDGILEELVVTIESDIAVQGTMAAFADDVEADMLVSELTLFIDGKEIDSTDAESDGTFVFDLDELELSEEDVIEITFEADLEDQDATPFQSVVFQVTELAFAGEDTDGDDLTDPSLLAIAVEGTELTSSLGDITYEVSNEDVFTAVDDTNPSTIEFDLEITNDSGADIDITDPMGGDFVFDYEGISGITITNISIESDDTDAPIAGGVDAGEILDGDSETFRVFATFTLENEDDVEVIVEEVLGVTPVEA